jgi:hypothetical protein
MPEGDGLGARIQCLRDLERAWRMACVTTGFSTDAQAALRESLATTDSPVSDRENIVRLLADVRAAACRCPGRAGRIDRRDDPRQDRFLDPHQLVVDAGDGDVARRCLSLLPEEWRTTLWLSAAEGMTAGDVASIVGIEPDVVSVVSSLCWKALRTACLDAYQRAEAPAACRPTVDRLRLYLQDGLELIERAIVDIHCESCGICAIRRRELSYPRACLLGAMPPIPPGWSRTSDDSSPSSIALRSLGGRSQHE